MLKKINFKIRLLYYKVKYLKTLKTEGRNRIEKRLSINKMKFNNSGLKVVLKKGSSIKHDVLIQGSSTFILGENSYIGSFSVIGCNESIKIGKNCMIAQGVSIRDTDHSFKKLNTPMNKQGIVTSAILIEDNVWIGYGAVITKGVKIGSGSIIGANAVVTKDVEPNSIVGGVPAKLIKTRG